MPFPGPWRSTKELADHAAMDIGQPVVATCMPVGEPLMIEAQLMQYGRM